MFVRICHVQLEDDCDGENTPGIKEEVSEGHDSPHPTPRFHFGVTTWG